MKKKGETLPDGDWNVRPTNRNPSQPCSRYIPLRRDAGVPRNGIGKITWASRTSVTPRLEELLNSPNRCPDQTQKVRDGWIVRRLAPDAMKIEFGDIAGHHMTRAEEEKLFKSMGAELAHLHAGRGHDQEIITDLNQRRSHNKGWFDSATKTWAEIVERDQKEFILPES